MQKSRLSNEGRSISCPAPEPGSRAIPQPRSEDISRIIPRMSRLLGTEGILEGEAGESACHRLRLSLGSDVSDFMSSYRLWAFDPADPAKALAVAGSIAFRFEYSGRLGLVFGVTPQDPREELPRRLAKHLMGTGPGELRDVYDALIKVMEDEGSGKALYESHIRAYAAMLDECERFGRTCQFISSYIIPSVERYGFLTRAQAMALAKRAPKEDLAKADGPLLGSLLEKGIGMPDWRSCQETLATKDSQRRSFHDEIRSYASSFGLGEMDVLADISIARNGAPNIRLAPQGGGIVITFGSLIVPQLIASNIDWASCRRGSDDPGILQLRERMEAFAIDVITRRERGERIPGAEYHSHSSNSTEERDRAISKAIADANTDLPMTTGFELSHVQHGVAVIVLRLRLPLSVFEGVSSSDGGALDRFVESAASCLRSR